MRKRVIVGAVLAVALAAAVPSQAQDLLYVSGPGEQFRGYTMPVFAIPAGTKVSYTNVDITAHNIQADVYGPTRAWCSPTQTLCPLFYAPPTPLGQINPIYGIDELEPGTYPFKCLYHSAQRGTLVVV